MRCRVNFPRFVRDYSDCVVGDFEKYIVRGLLILFAVLLNTIQVQSLQKAKLSK